MPRPPSCAPPAHRKCTRWRSTRPTSRRTKPSCNTIFDRFGDFDLVLVTFGVLGDQARAEQDPAAALEIVQTNFTGTVSVTVPLAARLRAQGHGTLVLLSSVAGERVRRSNFVYGSSKAGIDGYYQGLAASLAASGVHVMIVRPGFVHTKMTKGLKAAPLSVSADAVADAIVRGIARGATSCGCRPRCAT